MGDRRVTLPFRSDSKPAAPILFYRALGFVSAADAYVQTYGNRADSYITYFLLARAFELCLKTALRADGVSPRRLANRKLGHDLAALIRECNVRSISIIDPSVPDTAWGLHNLNEAYSLKELEYQELGRLQRRSERQTNTPEAFEPSRRLLTVCIRQDTLRRARNPPDRYLRCLVRQAA